MGGQLAREAQKLAPKKTGNQAPFLWAATSALAHWRGSPSERRIGIYVKFGAGALKWPFRVHSGRHCFLSFSLFQSARRGVLVWFANDLTELMSERRRERMSHKQQ